MPGEAKSRSPHALPSSAIVGFYAITFALTWGLVAPYILVPDAAASMFGEISGSHPLFFLATWSPAISAFLMVYRHAGWRGIRGLLSRLALWRIPVGWAAFVLVVPPVVYAAGSWVKGGPLLAPLPPGGAAPAIAGLFMMLFLGPIEEFGWRGLAQPILQRHMPPVFAGLLIGATWGLWHLPAFYLAGTVYADWNFLPFFVGNVVLAVLATPVLNRSKGGLLWPMLFHWQLINPFWPDAQPWDTWILAAVAAVIIWWDRDGMVGRAGAVTHVLPEPANRDAGGTA